MEAVGFDWAAYMGGVGKENMAFGLRGGLYGSGMGDAGLEGGKDRCGADGTDSRR